MYGLTARESVWLKIQPFTVQAAAAGVVIGAVDLLGGQGLAYLGHILVLRNCLEITLSDIRISGDGFRSSILHGIDLCGD